jgi:hypothetical protein
MCNMTHLLMLPASRRNLQYSTKNETINKGIVDLVIKAT